MPNANWSNPTLTSTYTNFVTEVKARDEDLALQFDGTTATNFPTGTIRWSSSVNRWQKWSGTAWSELTATYALTALSTTGNASIGGTLGVTGAATLSSTLGVTGALTCSSSVTGGSFVPTAATVPATAGVYYPAANTIGFGAAGAEVGRFTSTGRLGVGTNAPSAGLEVASAVSVPAAIFKVSTNEACRIDSLRRLLIGTATAIDEGSGVSRLQVAGIDTGSSNILVSRFSADIDTPRFTFTKSRGATVGTNTLVQSGDVLGRLEFKGANGSSYSAGAFIEAAVNGTASATAMPAQLNFFTTPNSTTTPVARLAILQNGQINANVPGNATTSLYPGFFARAWVNFDGSTAVLNATITPRGSGNVSSVTDRGTGLYEIAMNNALVDVNYCIVATCGDGPTNNYRVAQVSDSLAPTTSTFRIQTLSQNAGNPAATDHNRISVAVFR